MKHALSYRNACHPRNSSTMGAPRVPRLWGPGRARTQTVAERSEGSAVACSYCVAPTNPANAAPSATPRPGRKNRRLAVAALVLFAAIHAHASTYYVIVSGLGGEPDYEQRFTAAANDLNKAFTAEGPTAHVITLTGPNSTSAKLKEALTSVAGLAKPEDDFALILIGHGSFDGVEYKFNLVGPDITATDLATLCNHIASRRQLIVDTTSSSGGAIPALERPGRAVIAATKSGNEKNATVFARYFVEAFQDPSADTDKSDSISAMEAFAYAARKTADFYDSQKRLATEHAVFNDVGSGDGVREASGDEGKLLSSFTMLRIGADAQQAANNPAMRFLLDQKDELEQKIDSLKYRKPAMDPADYKNQLRDALLQLAEVQAKLDAGVAPGTGAAPGSGGAK